MRILVILFIIFSWVFSNAQSEKEEAKKAFMDIVSCYFKKDCTKFYSNLNDSITLLNVNTNDHISSKLLLEKKKSCEKFTAYIEKTKSLDYYFKNYLVAVMDYNEYTSPDRAELRKYFFEMSGSPMCLMRVNAFNKFFTKNDYLVIGDIPKEKKPENFVGSPYIMMLRKTKAGWKISAFTE
ncbi:MAG: hypothetical protein Q7W45_03420 [Bacteroidota bacterium]|nr:hypothetical protein [Bacteroidota bacterium]MDP3143853.1 hypothetical protein [Bacteroidota bacterium]